MEIFASETPNAVAVSFSSKAKRPLYLPSSLVIIEPTMPAPIMITSCALAQSLEVGKSLPVVIPGVENLIVLFDPGIRIEVERRYP